MFCLSISRKIPICEADPRKYKPAVLVSEMGLEYKSQNTAEKVDTKIPVTISIFSITTLSGF